MNALEHYQIKKKNPSTLSWRPTRGSGCPNVTADTLADLFLDAPYESFCYFVKTNSSNTPDRALRDN